MEIDDLPSERDNRIVWCERCQRHHDYYTMTREKYQAIVSASAQELADAIDRDAVAKVYGVIMPKDR